MQKYLKRIVIFIILMGFGSISVNAQSEKSNYLGINLIPLIGNNKKFI